MSDDDKQPSEAAQRVLDGTAWTEFCDRLKAAGNHILSDAAPADPLNRAEGFRYLTRLMRCSLEAFVEYADPLYPVLRRMVHETAKIGADNPDNWYENAPLHGDHVYRIRGTRGTVHYLSLAVQAGHYGSGGGNMPPVGAIEAKDLHVEQDGTLEITISREKHEGNWLPLPEGDALLVVRQTFLDRATEQRAKLKIERVGGPEHPEALSAEALDKGLTTAANMVNMCAMIFPGWANGFQKHVNRLPKFDPNMARAFGGDPNIVYYHSYWRLAEDEALVIDAAPPACDYWNFQLNNHWMESLDYRYFNVVINSRGAQLNEDGSVRVVVAHRDPGVPNWLSTAGHVDGTMCWRWVRAEDDPEPETRVVKLADLS